MNSDLADFQIDFAGVVIGAGTAVPVSDIEGLGAPDLRTHDVDNPVEDGAFPGADLYEPRTVRIEAAIRCPADPAAAFDVLARLQQAADAPNVREAAGEVAVLRVKRPGAATRRLYGRIRRVEATSTTQALFGWLPLDLAFHGLDPRWYADTASGLTLPLDTSTDAQGFRAPIVAPITTGVADPTTRPGWLDNNGTLPTWPSLRLTGPVTNPRIWIVETGRALDLALSLRDGEHLDIATRPGTRWVLRNTTANAATALSPPSRLDLFQIPRGRSEIRWTATDYTNTCRLAITWRDAYTAL